MESRYFKLCGISAGLMAALSAVCLGQVNKIFSDHMVLQRDMPVPVWGTATPGSRIMVKFAQQEKTAEADKDGKWIVSLDALKASSTPAELLVTSATGNQLVKIADVLVGDVYLCSGQSNMQLQMHRIKAEDDIAKADFPGIRHSREGNGWTVCSPKTIGDFTAVGYYFGRRIHQETGIPVGLLHNAIPGTAIEPWIAPAGLNTTPTLKEAELRKMVEYHKLLTDKLSELERWLKTADAAIGPDTEFPVLPSPAPPPVNPGYSTLYTGCTLPLIPFAIKGMLWYQGESNSSDDDYDHKMSALINGLRKVWNQGDFPVYFAQLPAWQSPNDNPAGGDGWAKFRMGQLKSLTIPHTGMAVTIDVGDTGDVHPLNKFDVGNRLAQWALAKDYPSTTLRAGGKAEDLVCSGPLYKSMKVEEGKIRIAFDHVGKGLMVGSKKGRDPVQQDPGGKLKQFAIAAADPAAPNGLKWFWADAVIEGDTVAVSSPEVQQPVAVHYAYSGNPEGCNLYNKDGLPASPFRTEK